VAASVNARVTVRGGDVLRLTDPDSDNGSAHIGAWLYASERDDQDVEADEDHTIVQ